MKKLLTACVAAWCGALWGETAAEAEYARLSAYRGIWETNVIAYVKTAALKDDRR